MNGYRKNRKRKVKKIFDIQKNERDIFFKKKKIRDNRLENGEEEKIKRW